MAKNIQNRFCKNIDVHRYDTRFKDNFFQDHTVKTLRNVNKRGIELWNNFPSKLKECANLNIFRNKLKKELLFEY